MERTILHCDLNNFYASCECMMDPELRDKPVAVCGSVEERHGIVLAKNYHAKKYGVSTAEPVWQAKAKCPNLVIVPPRFDLYVKYSKIVKGIYTDYTDKVESFGLDECWLDISGRNITEKEGFLIADEIRERVKRETGLTISVGVSFNKVFAKLGSDMKKPDAVTVITREGFRDQIWSLPASYLLGVGRKTKKVLDKYCIDTIGKIAAMPKEFFEGRMGKSGVQLWRYANGEDTSAVTETDRYIPAKSFGHGTTTPKDLTDGDAVWAVMLHLTQDIGRSLRINGQKASGVSVMIRDCKLVHKQWQCKLPIPTGSSLNIAKAAFALFSNSYGWENPLRSVTVTAINLVSASAPVQTNLFDDTREFERVERMEECAWTVKERFGINSIMPAALLGKDNEKVPEMKTFLLGGW
ncbi:MAG: DNA polymerase IV [Clostridia bacterium]|nr:DNA polymerase IV [Clostridia bacterium]